MTTFILYMISWLLILWCWTYEIFSHSWQLYALKLCCSCFTFFFFKPNEYLIAKMIGEHNNTCIPFSSVLSINFLKLTLLSMQIKKYINENQKIDTKKNWNREKANAWSIYTNKLESFMIYKWSEVNPIEIRSTMKMIDLKLEMKFHKNRLNRLVKCKQYWRFDCWLVALT